MKSVLTCVLIAVLTEEIRSARSFPRDPFGDGVDDSGDLPFDELATRPPATLEERKQAIVQKSLDELNRPSVRPEPRKKKRKHGRNRRPGGPAGYYRPAVGGPLYNVYPILYPKSSDYCPQMRAQFRYTCQPSKPLRLDLVEFCKQYASFCGVINTHRLPGPGIGPRPVPGEVGHVAVSGNFNFGIGVVPGLEVNAGWGVDVGPIPGMGDSVGVGIDSGVGIMGSSSPLAYRRGMDRPEDAKGGLVGVSGGVGVAAPGAGNVGVGGGVGVGR